MCEMYLDHVETGPGGIPGGGDKLRGNFLHVRRRHLAGDGAVFQVRYCRRRNDFPRTVGQRLIDATLPRYAGCALATGVTDLCTDFRLAVGMDEFDDALPSVDLLVAPDTGTARRNASRR